MGTCFDFTGFKNVTCPQTEGVVNLSSVCYKAFMRYKIPKIAFRKKGEKDFEFEIMTLKHLYSDSVEKPFSLDTPHRVNFYHIIFITRGNGHHYIDFKPYEFSEGSLLFVSAGQVQAFHMDSEIDGFLIIFTEDFLTRNMAHSDVLTFSRLYNYHLYPPDIHSLDMPESIFSPVVKEIYNEYIFVETFAKEEMLRTLLKLLLLKAERVKQTRDFKDRKSEWVLRFSEFLNLLSAHYAEDRNADLYAGKMGISYNHLNKIVKAMTGNTAKAFIDSFIVLEIKRRLAVSDISIKELTYEMGFDEPTNFVKYFKKHTHTSPAQFRKAMVQ